MTDVIWCDRCNLPMDCPDHPDGIPVRYGDEVGFMWCGCPTPTCACDTADIVCWEGWDWNALASVDQLADIKADMERP